MNETPILTNANRRLVQSAVNDSTAGQPSPVPYFLRPVAGSAVQPERLTVTAKRFPVLPVIAVAAVGLFLLRRFMKRRR